MQRVNHGPAWRRRIAAATIAILAFGTAASGVSASGIRNCVDLTGKNAARVGCYELVWSGGTEYRMTFSNQSFDGATPQQLDRFYVLAPQTATAQGYASWFLHDHVVGDVPGNGGTNTLKLTGVFVICSEQGLTTGSCEGLWQSLGGPAMPFAGHVNGQALTSTGAIEAAAVAGDVILLELGPSSVIVASISRSH
jgi:hypothetical protein